MIGDFSLTSRPHQVYAPSIATQVAIGFSSSKQKRTAAISGIFTSEYVTRLSFIGRVIWGTSCPPVLLSGLLTHLIRPPYQQIGAGFLTVLGDRCHDFN